MESKGRLRTRNPLGILGRAAVGQRVLHASFHHTRCSAIVTFCVCVFVCVCVWTA